MSLINILKLPDSNPSVTFEKTGSIFKETIPEIKRQRKQYRDYEADNTKTYKGGKVFKETDKKTCEWTLMQTPTDIENRSSDLNAKDIQCLESSGLKINLAVILKPIWATGMSAGETAKINRGKRYYSVRNLEKYWAIFNKNSYPENKR